MKCDWSWGLSSSLKGALWEEYTCLLLHLYRHGISFMLLWDGDNGRAYRQSVRKQSTRYPQ